MNGFNGLDISDSTLASLAALDDEVIKGGKDNNLTPSVVISTIGQEGFNTPVPQMAPQGANEAVYTPKSQIVTMPIEGGSQITIYLLDCAFATATEIVAAIEAADEGDVIDLHLLAEYLMPYEAYGIMNSLLFCKATVNTYLYWSCSSLDVAIWLCGKNKITSDIACIHFRPKIDGGCGPINELLGDTVQASHEQRKLLSAFLAAGLLRSEEFDEIVGRNKVITLFGEPLLERAKQLQDFKMQPVTIPPVK